MATVTASHLLSTICQVNSHGADTKAANLICMKNQAAMTHNGLRFLNMLDRLQMRTNAKAVARQAVKQENPRPCAKIICGKGLNLVFVGAECGPWSKTGGLGDVLGGLPPAMAVSIV